MKPIYYHEESNSIADVCHYNEHNNARLITRINVPKAFRGRGLGSLLLKEICADADEEGITLYLEVLASGDLSSRDLHRWYKRHGFEVVKYGFLRRPPRGVD